MTAPSPSSYLTVQHEIIRRVRAREWAPGDLIPNEVALASEFGCARATMNRALRELADAGILERKRRAGTRVARNPIRRATLRIPLIRDEVEAEGSAYRYQLRSRCESALPDDLTRQLGVSSRQVFLHLTGLHLKDDAPFQFEDRWINPVAVPAVRTETFADISPNEWLVRETPFSEGGLALSAAPATPEAADALGVPTGTALFVVDRVTWLDATPITAVTMAYPPGYRMRLGL